MHITFNSLADLCAEIDRKDAALGKARAFIAEQLKFEVYNTGFGTERGCIMPDDLEAQDEMTDLLLLLDNAIGDATP